MKKVFFQVPISNREFREVARDELALLLMAIEQFGEFESINTHESKEEFEVDRSEDPIRRIGKSIQMMADADYFVGINITGVFPDHDAVVHVADDFFNGKKFIVPLEDWIQAGDNKRVFDDASKAIYEKIDTQEVNERLRKVRKTLNDMDLVE